MSIHDRMVERIDRAMPLVTKLEDDRVLFYVRSQLTPRALARRPEDQQDVSHLHDVARSRLAPYEKEAHNA